MKYNKNFHDSFVKKEKRILGLKDLMQIVNSGKS